MNIENERISMSFDDYGRMVGMTSADGVVRVPIDEKALTEPFAIELRRPDKSIVAVVPGERPTMSRADEGDCRVLALDWSIGGRWGELTVHVKIVLHSSAPISMWRIEVENNTDSAIWQVSFPRVTGLGSFAGPGGRSWLAGPFQLGERLPDPVAFVNGNAETMGAFARVKAGARDCRPEGNDLAFAYPGMWTMQYLAYGHPATGGVYFAAHDACALYKRFGMYADSGDSRHAALVLKQYPEDRTAVGAGFASFYPAAVGVYQGDWWGASEIYREWALEQTWCRKGTTKTRKDIPAWTKDLDLWYWNWQSPQFGHPNCTVPAIEYLKQRLGCEIAFHWYGFNGELFDSCWREPEVYPENDDIRRTLVAGVRRLHDAGVRCIPYINYRLWNTDNLAFREAGGRKWLAVDENGKPGDEWVGLGCAMCPTARPLHDILRRITNEMIDECEMDGAYLDQVTSCFAVPCFNREHDHKPGGHGHWHRGYRELLENVQRDIKERSPDNIITSESVIECFLDLFDLDLGYNLSDLGDGLGRMGSAAGLPIPMFQSVYHDYHMTYGTSQTFKRADMDHFRYAEALCLVAGQQLGVSDFFVGDEEAPGTEPYLSYLETLTEAHKAARKWLNLGVWKAPVDVTCGRVEIAFSNSHPPKSNIPAIINGCFELDGELCIVLVNHTASRQAGVFTLEPGAYGLAGTSWELRSLFPAREEPLREGTASSLTYEAMLSPGSVEVVVVVPGDEESTRKE